MRYLILTDIHGNHEALQAVLRQVRRKRFDAMVVLGDLVGYGAAPNQVLDTLRQLRYDIRYVRGNHDKVAAGIDEGIGFNAVALSAARWTRERLSCVNLRFLRELPPGPVEENGFVYCHGSPLDEDAYVFTKTEAYAVFRGYDFRLCFFGHTHVACCFTHSEEERTGLTALEGGRGKLELRPGVRYFINPGAVGQPRDRDPRAAYAIYDSEREVVYWFRTDYPVSRAQRRILKAGLPRVLADRLARGA